MDEVRLINATPLEKEMREYALYIGRETTDECESTAEYCADMVSEAHTIDTETILPQWIDVQDKLPEEYQSVLGVANGVDVRIVHYEFGGFWIEDTTGEEYNVTYWMPLPEIPKEN